MGSDRAGLLSLAKITRGYWLSFLVAFISLIFLNVLSIIPPMAIGRLVDSFLHPTGKGTPTLIALAVIGIALLQGVVRYPMRMGLQGGSIRVAGELREKYVERILLSANSCLSRWSAGDLLGRATGDCGTVEHSLSTGFLFVIDCGLCLITLPGAMIFLSPRLSLYSLPSVILVPFLAHLLVRQVTQAGKEAQESYGRLAERAHEHLSTVETIRAFRLEDREREAFAVASNDYFKKDMVRGRREVLFSGLVQITIALGVFIVLLGGGGLATRGQLTTGQFIAFLQYMGMLAWPLSGLAWVVLLFEQGRVSLSRMNEIGGASGGHAKANSEVHAPAVGIEIRGLTYSYAGSKEPTLSNISFRIGPGQRVALMGPSGSGKSTLVKLLARLLEPPPQRIFVDGRDVVTLPFEVLRCRLAVIPQESVLFAGAIDENIALGLEEAGRHREQIVAAAQTALVTRGDLPEGLKTVVAGMGSNLSGGQRQRVALARGLIRQSAHLVLDDGCSALDEEAEAKILENISSQEKQRATLLVTHRVKTAGRCNRVLIIEAGSLVEEGSPEELLRRKGSFARMVDRQGLSDELFRV